MQLLLISCFSQWSDYNHLVFPVPYWQKETCKHTIKGEEWRYQTFPCMLRICLVAKMKGAPCLFSWVKVSTCNPRSQFRANPDILIEVREFVLPEHGTVSFAFFAGWWQSLNKMSLGNAFPSTIAEKFREISEKWECQFLLPWTNKVVELYFWLCWVSVLIPGLFTQAGITLCYSEVTPHHMEPNCVQIRWITKAGTGLIPSEG